MMLYPPVAELVSKTGNRYQLVNLVARRAREISANAEEEGVILDKKPFPQLLTKYTPASLP